MTDAVKVGFVPFSTAPRGILVVFCDDTLKLGAATRKALGAAADLVKRAAATNQFKGKSGSTLDILAPAGLKASRLIVVGAGKLAALKDNDFLKLGGVAAGKLRAGNDAVTIIAELPDGAMKPDQAAAVASGVRLRAYKFDRYKTKKKDGEDAALHADISLAVGDVARREKPSRRIRTSSMASSPRATSSMSRRTYYSRWNSRAVPPSCASSASMSRFSTSRR
jgi:leucyl aminopeptidase